MNELRQYSTEKLQAEIERRGRKIELPRPLDAPDWDGFKARVIDSLHEYIADVDKGDVPFMYLPLPYSRDVYEVVYGGEAFVEFMRQVKERAGVQP